MIDGVRASLLTLKDHTGIGNIKVVIVMGYHRIIDKLKNGISIS